MGFVEGKRESLSLYIHCRPAASTPGHLPLLAHALPAAHRAGAGVFAPGARVPRAQRVGRCGDGAGGPGRQWPAHRLGAACTAAPLPATRHQGRWLGESATQARSSPSRPARPYGRAWRRPPLSPGRALIRPLLLRRTETPNAPRQVAESSVSADWLYLKLFKARLGRWEGRMCALKRRLGLLCAVIGWARWRRASCHWQCGTYTFLIPRPARPARTSHPRNGRTLK
jgi:hypothetical protein